MRRTEPKTRTTTNLCEQWQWRGTRKTKPKNVRIHLLRCCRRRHRCCRWEMGYKFSLAHYLMRRLYIRFFCVVFFSLPLPLPLSRCLLFGQVSQVQFGTDSQLARVRNTTRSSLEAIGYSWFPAFRRFAIRLPQDVRRNASRMFPTNYCRNRHTSSMTTIRERDHVTHEGVTRREFRYPQKVINSFMVTRFGVRRGDK